MTLRYQGAAQPMPSFDKVLAPILAQAQPDEERYPEAQKLVIGPLPARE